MGYKKAAQVLPEELLVKIQEYIDGEFLYIPRVSEKKKGWGASTSTREELRSRNSRIYTEYLTGLSMAELEEKYFLSQKSIQRIIRQQKINVQNETALENE